MTDLGTAESATGRRTTPEAGRIARLVLGLLAVIFLVQAAYVDGRALVPNGDRQRLLQREWEGQFSQLFDNRACYMRSLGNLQPSC